MALRLKEALRPSDTVARLGGDEFGVLLPISASDHARHVAGKILKTFGKPFEIEGLPIVVETGIGIALYPNHGFDPYSLVQRADVALYASKREKIDYLIYNPVLDENSPRRLALMGELKRALANRELFLHYQPKINLQNRQVTGAEALVRWKHPLLGIVPPAQFILPAEQTGLIKPVTQFVIEEAIKQCRVCHQSKPDFSLSINLSVRNLQDPELPNHVNQLLQVRGVNPSMLNFEITESAIMTNAENAIKTILLLTQKGINFSIDDFGIGYSSLSYLKKLPVKFIKIDKSFVKDMIVNEEDAMIVRSTIHLAHDLNLKVIAEGVENMETLESLAAFGCDEAQGYFISPPIPPEELSTLLNKNVSLV